MKKGLGAPSKLRDKQSEEGERTLDLRDKQSAFYMCRCIYISIHAHTGQQRQDGLRQAGRKRCRAVPGAVCATRRSRISDQQRDQGQAIGAKGQRAGMADHERDRPPRNLRAGLDAHVTSLDLQGLDLLGAHDITCLAVGTDGTRVVCTGSALYTLSPSRLPTLLAGHQITTGFIDNAQAGQGGAARFCSSSGIAVDGAGNVLVVDTGSTTRCARLHAMVSFPRSQATG